MSKFGTSQPVRRVEDSRFLTGHGRYVDDLAPKDAARAAFLRTPVAHARIASIDVSEARQAPGVRLVLTGADLETEIVNDVDAAQLKNRDGTMSARPQRPVLAADRVRYVGEAVALVVADTLAEAKDALDLIEVE